MGSIATFWKPGYAWPDLVLKHLTETPEKLTELKKKFPGMFNGRGPGYPYLGFLVQTPWVKSQFLWVDQNGDGLVQESEIRLLLP